MTDEDERELESDARRLQQEHRDLDGRSMRCINRLRRICCGCNG